MPSPYEIREIDQPTLDALLAAHGRRIFEDELQTFRPREALDATALAKLDALKAGLGVPYRLQLGAFLGDEPVGWSWGVQEGADTFYMVNSAVLPEHRGKGLYQALLEAVLARATEVGFTRVYSRHVATNNAVIVPKLKAGFVITGMELSDRYGTLVHLTCFPQALRHKVLAYRAGALKPDAEIAAHVGV